MNDISKQSSSSTLPRQQSNVAASRSEGAAIVRVLAAVLDRLTLTNAQTKNDVTTEEQQVTKFHALKPPQISIQAYLDRIHKYASCSSECFVLALIYIDRLISKNNFLLTDLNVHRVLITAVMLAAKFFDDAYYNNAYYAKVGGIAVSELNILEVEFLFRIHFQLHCASDTYRQYHSELVHHALCSTSQSHEIQQSFQMITTPTPSCALPIQPHNYGSVGNSHIHDIHVQHRANALAVPAGGGGHHHGVAASASTSGYHYQAN